MQFADTVDRRRMVRRYRPDPVDPHIVEGIVDTARRGPSAGFSQAFDVVAVTSETVRGRIAELCDEPAHVARGREPWLSVAPVHLVPCVRPAAYRARYAETDKERSRGPERWAVPFWWLDGGAALMLLLLAVVDAELGAGVLDIADRDGLRGLLEIPTDVEPLCLVTIGYAAATQPQSSGTRRPRRALSDQLHWQRWHHP